jgi:hypothetical protein
MQKLGDAMQSVQTCEGQGLQLLSGDLGVR